ncbi:homoserine dehydrogenase [Candidatus Bathyarchaeota archaeon]|nr:homoserine dehydrogenase [Candidatus Bathyarchaeota archaeon]
MRIAIIGYGTVGQALAEILARKKREILRLYGFEPSVVAAVDSAGAAVDSHGLDVERLLRLKKSGRSLAAFPVSGRKDMTGMDVIEDVDADTVVEATPTRVEDGEPGLSHIEAALRRKRHVVATNKGPLAIALPALMELADYRNVALRFSGTVGAGTPILDFGRKCLLGDRVISIRGILNGTSNYILTRMSEAGVTLGEALKEAQKAGYAEADPTYDIEGIDTACKLVIMANWVMGRNVTIKDVHINGITGVTQEDVTHARSEGKVIKLLGTIEEEILVRPTVINANHPLAVGGALNAVSFNAEYAGEVTVVGKGAGGVETAGAVLRDLIDIRRTAVAVQGGRT